MPSAGNAGGALAAYAAVAGMQATVVMPSDAPIVNQAEVAACGADLILVDGLISDCGRLTARIAEHTGAFNLSTLKEPYRVEGKKTMGIELAEELGWIASRCDRLSDGRRNRAHRDVEGFRGARVDGLDRWSAAPDDRCAGRGLRASGARVSRGHAICGAVGNASTDAAGLRVPSTVGDFLVLEAINASGGTAIAVPEAELAPTQAFAAQSWRWVPEPRVGCRLRGVARAPWPGGHRTGRHGGGIRHRCRVQIDAPGLAGATNRRRERRRLGVVARQLRTRLSYNPVHATRSSAGMVLMTISAETSHAAARSHPRSCHSS